jgi:folate-binding protein YgfZ
MAEMTNGWLQYLAQHGAGLTESAMPEVIGFSEDATTVGSRNGLIAPLTDLGLIAATGEDAAHFLHNQLTNDVQNLTDAEARLAGYCSPKGRLLASLLIWKSADAVMLQLPRQIQAAVQKRLQMFILRAKATLTDATDRHAILGLAGESAASVLTEWFKQMPDKPYAKSESAAGTLIRLADAAGVPRYQWLTHFDAARAAWPELIRTLRPVGAHAWRLTDIEAGIPQITQATQEQFVPQMVNFEAVGGVNFRKGCYPGQEIVARSQYLGKLKRRMMPASIAATHAHAGMEIFSSADPEQPCGMLVNAEMRAPNQVECLAEIKTTSLDQGTVHLGSANGPILQFKPLPYSLPESA